MSAFEMTIAAASHAIAFPDLGLDPILLQIGPFALRWYSIAYLAGIFVGYWYLLKLIAQPGSPLARRHAAVGRTNRCSRRRGTIGFWEFVAQRAPPLLNLVVRRSTGFVTRSSHEFCVAAISGNRTWINLPRLPSWDLP